MHADHDIAGLTGQLVADCGLDTTSVFLCDRTGAAPRIAYLHHVNVSAEAQHGYRDHGVFLSDPFIRLTEEADDWSGPGFVRWGDRRLDALADKAPAYRAFLGQHDVAVVGALGRRITPHLSLIIGAHRQSRAQWDRGVSLALLEQRLGRLADTVITRLLGQMLTTEAGQMALRTVLPGSDGAETAPLPLTPREAEIAGRVCRGLRNKEIAWQLDLSEFTVENHLRRIYRKLGIHNRTALVAQFSRRHGLQAII